MTRFNAEVYYDNKTDECRLESSTTLEGLYSKIEKGETIGFVCELSLGERGGLDTYRDARGDLNDIFLKHQEEDAIEEYHDNDGRSHGLILSTFIDQRLVGAPFRRPYGFQFKRWMEAAE